MQSDHLAGASTGASEPAQPVDAVASQRMDPELKAKWVAALRSGGYKQGKGQLHLRDPERYCCLGVLCVVAGVDVDDRCGQEDYMPEKVVTLSGLKTDVQSFLADKNDRGKAFAEIADYIDANL